MFLKKNASHSSLIQSCDVYFDADIEKPIITNFPNDTSRNAGEGVSHIAVEWIEPIAKDNSDHVTLIGDHKSGDKFPIGETDVTYVAFDESGNTASDTFVVHIRGEIMIICFVCVGVCVCVGGGLELIGRRVFTIHNQGSLSKRLSSVQHKFREIDENNRCI